MRLIFSGYPKPVSDLPEELLDQLYKLRLNGLELNRVLHTLAEKELPEADY